MEKKGCCIHAGRKLGPCQNFSIHIRAKQCTEICFWKYLRSKKRQCTCRIFIQRCLVLNVCSELVSRTSLHPTFCTLNVREVWCTKKCRSTICSSNNSPGAKGKRVIWRPFASDCVGSSCHCSNECVLLCRSLDTGVKGVNLLKEVGGRWCGPESRGRCGRWRTRIERLP